MSPLPHPTPAEYNPPRRIGIRYYLPRRTTPSDNTALPGTCLCCSEPLQFQSSMQLHTSSLPHSLRRVGLVTPLLRRVWGLLPGAENLSPRVGGRMVGSFPPQKRSFFFPADPEHVIPGSLDRGPVPDLLYVNGCSVAHGSSSLRWHREQRYQPVVGEWSLSSRIQKWPRMTQMQPSRRRLIPGLRCSRRIAWSKDRPRGN